MYENRDKIKLANMLYNALAELMKARMQHITEKLSDFNYQAAELAKQTVMFRSAIERGWFSSADTMSERINHTLNDLLVKLQWVRTMTDSSDKSPLPELTDIYAGIIQAQEEFEGINIDFDAGTISVVTEPVILEGFQFGEFAIKLFIDRIARLYDEIPYRVIALSPYPASTDSNVTHPHVSNERLCEGDGHISIRRALEQGRICDFFMLVANILKNYNPESPYVSLEEWDGLCCYECGYNISAGDSYYCEYCEHDFCSECCSYCPVCDTVACVNCSSGCSVCGQIACQQCISNCKDCGCPVCKECINQEGLCPDCARKRKESDNEEQQDKATTKQQTPENNQPPRQERLSPATLQSEFTV